MFRLVLLCAGLLAAGVASAAFTDITDSSGLGPIVAARYAVFPDWWLSGLHLVDLDEDGHLDLFLSSHGGGDALALLGDGSGHLAVAAGSYPTTELHLNYDFDEDGKNDLTMTYVDGGAQWWKNDSAPGALDIRATGLTRDGNTGRTQVLADFDRDGNVDWLRAAPPGIEIDLGDGAGGFAQDSISIAVPGTGTNDNANVIPGDFDNDGDIDLLVMVGGGYDDTNGRTHYYRNDGLAGGVPQYSDQTAASGLPVDGLVVKGVGDYDTDGDLDLIGIYNKELPPVVYRNDGHGVFTQVADAIAGVDARSLTYAAWGTAVKTDFDNDGIPDILMNGKYYLMLLRGTGDAHFEYMNDAWNIVDVCPCSIDGGLTFGDIDGDGDLDIAGYSTIDEPYQVKLYRNDNPAQHWLRVRPIGSHGNRGATGAKIRLFAPGTLDLVGYESVAIYCFQAAASYYGGMVTERHFGLGAGTSVDVEVEFYPSGRIVRRSGVAADEAIEVREDSDLIFANGFE
ncbi:MAG TPA: CRTAC1 family protein [Rhodanobacteraceae bacterium]|nr:CRTAC1 family protein [Rhodanobacteraceae bacterium]